MKKDTDVDEVAAIAQSLKRQTETETKKAEARQGEKGREHFAGLRKQLAAHLIELRKLRPLAAKVKAAGEAILKSGAALSSLERRGLETHCRELAGAANGKAENSVEWAIQKIDDISTDNPRDWPRDDFAAGALANLPTARGHYEGLVELIKQIGAQADVTAVREVEEHPLANDVEHGRGDGIRVLSNAPEHHQR